FLVGLVALVSACDAPDGEFESIDPADEAAALEIVDNLRLAGYPASEIEVREDGTVVAGGDAVVTLEASREMIGAGEAVDADDIEFRHYRSTNLISPSIDRICVDGSALTGTASAALDDALANYTDLNLAFDMVRTSGPAVGCDTLITIKLFDGSSGSSGFPFGLLPYPTIWLGDDIAPNFGAAVTTHVITHELGHCIGLRHTDYYDRSISCGGSTADEGDAGLGAIHIPGTPTTATANSSVMNACYNAGNTGQWSAADITALTTLYPKLLTPPVPSPLSKQSDVCFGSYTMNWTAQLGAAYYQLYRSTSSGFSSPVQLYSGNATSTEIDVPSGTWYLRARACNNYGCSAWTNQVAVKRLFSCN
ncbi:MAG: hypothetical protein EKK62_01380, partial [Acidimicrobiia bacterium]